MAVGDKLSRLTLQNQPPETPTLPSDLWLTPGPIITGLAKHGEPIATGVPFLDARLRRGGVLPGRIITIGGAAYTGKTTILADCALHMSQRCRVFALFSDEGRAQAAVRLGVMLGVPIDEIEEHPEIAGPKIDELMGERSLALLKPEHEGVCAEMVFRYAAEQCKGEPGVVILDSIQTIRPFEDERTAKDERSGIKSFMKLARRCADEFNLVVLLTSQSPRSFYRAKKSEDRASALAAFLGDSSIEYLSDVCMTLSIPEKGSEIVELEIPKNRLRPFKKTTPPYTSVFSVRYESSAGRVLEVDSVTVDEASTETSRRQGVEIERMVLKELTKNVSGLTRTQVEELVPGRSVAVRNALYRMRDEHPPRVFTEQDGRKILYRLC